MFNLYKLTRSLFRETIFGIEHYDRDFYYAADGAIPIDRKDIILPRETCPIKHLRAIGHRVAVYYHRQAHWPKGKMSSYFYIKADAQIEYRKARQSLMDGDYKEIILSDYIETYNEVYEAGEALYINTGNTEWVFIVEHNKLLFLDYHRVVLRREPYIYNPFIPKEVEIAEYF